MQRPRAGELFCSMGRESRRKRRDEATRVALSKGRATSREAAVVIRRDGGGLYPKSHAPSHLHIKPSRLHKFHHVDIFQITKDAADDKNVD